MSITTDLVGTNDIAEAREYFSWEQAKEMKDSGLVEFHSHGKRHMFYRELPVEEFKTEILESINIINSNLGIECNAFVYPYSSYNNYMVKTIKDSGIKIQMYDARNK